MPEFFCGSRVDDNAVDANSCSSSLSWVNFLPIPTILVSDVDSRLLWYIELTIDLLQYSMFYEVFKEGREIIILTKNNQAGCDEKRMWRTMSFSWIHENRQAEERRKMEFRINQSIKHQVVIQMISEWQQTWQSWRQSRCFHWLWIQSAIDLDDRVEWMKK